MKKENSNKNIVIVTGGTGGHIYPAITLGEYLSKKYLNVSFITDYRGLNNKNLAKLNPALINVRGLAGKSFLYKLTSLFLILISFFKSLFLLIKKNTDLVLGFGSYVQVPVILAAKVLNVKIILHEANLVLGNANKYLWNFAKVRSAAFSILNSSKNFEVVGMPVRSNIKELFRRVYKAPKRNEKINLLILGGSLGSVILSRSLSTQICLLPPKIKRRLHIFHQSKKDDIKYISSQYRNNQISSEVKSYFNNIHKKLYDTTLVICRAGASTISENLISGLPAIYIPLSNSIDNHQLRNAEMIKSYNAGRIINENEISKEKFLNLLTDLLNSNSLLEKMSRNCRDISSPDATEKLYKLIFGVLNEQL